MNTRSGDDLCEFFLFITSIENCDVQHHSSYTGSIAIYSHAGFAREVARDTHMWGSQFVILTPSKSRCEGCTPRKIEWNLSFLQIPFLVTSINLEENKDVICRVPLSRH